MMQLEVGKYYLTRDGKKVGPMCQYEVCDNTFDVTDEDEHWGHSGLHGEGVYGHKPGLDIIAEWQDETPAMTAIEHLRKACELLLADGKDKAAFDVLGVVLDHE